jgi:hypothetical protein
MIADLIRTGIAPNGTIEFESSYAAHHDLYEGIFMSSWSSPVTTTDSLTTVSATRTVTMTAAFTSLAVEDWFEIQDSAANDGWYQIESRTSNDEVVAYPSDYFGADATAEASVTILNDGILKNGTTRNSFTFEEEYQDLTTTFLTYRGVVLGTLTLNINADSILTGTFADMMGGSQADAAVEHVTATVGDGSPTAAPTNDVLNAITDITAIAESSVLSTYLINNLSLTLTNNLRGRAALGNYGPADVKLGTVNVNGNLNAYWGDASKAMFDAHLAGTQRRLAFLLKDGAGNAEAWTISALKYGAGSPEMGTLDSDVMSNMTFQGMLKSGLDTMIKVDRFTA